MPFKYNHHEAREEFYFTGMAACILIFAFITYPIYLHFDGALKYVLVKHFGQEVAGTVVLVKKTTGTYKAPRSLRRFKNFTPDIRVDVKHGGNTDKTFSGSFALSGKDWEFSEGQSIQIRYFYRDPSIFLPTALLSLFAFDLKFAGFGLLALSATICLFFVIFWRWRRFRRRMRDRYG